MVLHKTFDLPEREKSKTEPLHVHRLIVAAGGVRLSSTAIARLNTSMAPGWLWSFALGLVSNIVKEKVCVGFCGFVVLGMNS